MANDIPHHVSIVIRVEGQNSFAFLTHEARQNKWFLPTGKVEQNESNHDAVVRELREETGLILPAGVKLQEFCSFGIFQNENQISQMTMFARLIYRLNISRARHTV